MALDVLPGGSESLQPRKSLCLLAGEAQPHASPRACSLLGNPAIRAGWEGGSQAGTGWHLVWGRSSSFWLVSDPKVSTNLDFRKHHRGPQAPEVAVKAGLYPIRNFGLKSQGARRDAYGRGEPSEVLLTPNCKPSRSFSVQEWNL